MSAAWIVPINSLYGLTSLSVSSLVGDRGAGSNELPHAVVRTIEPSELPLYTMDSKARNVRLCSIATGRMVYVNRSFSAETELERDE